MPELSLVDVFADVPDPRSRQGRRYPLAPVLSLVTLGLLMGYKSVSAICEIPESYGADILLALGFPRRRCPRQTALRDLLAALDARSLEGALARWIDSRLPGGTAVLSIDGKTLRGSRDGEVPGHHLLAAYAPHVQAVLAQVRVDAKTNEHKAALNLLADLVLEGRLITGDAMFCQRDLSRRIIDRGGHYLWTVKENQPTLLVDIQAALNPGAEEALPPPTATHLA